MDIAESRLKYIGVLQGRIVEAKAQRDELLAACECAANVLSLLEGEVKALGFRADRVSERLEAAIANCKGETK